MREIKFRAWLKELEEMIPAEQVIGIVLEPIDENLTLDRILKYSHLPLKGGFTIDGENSENYILMQFTGLCDKNGKEIYEGDVFRYEKHPAYLLDTFVSCFIWGNEFGCFGYNVQVEIIGEMFSPLSIHDELKHDFLSHIEIIGNIYSNPELISGNQ